jgi:membrane dipeptidase
VIADAHCDLLLELALRRGEANPFATYWLPKLEQGGIKLQVCAIYAGLEHLPEGGLRRALEQVVAFERAARENPADVVLVRTSDDVAAVGKDERIGLILAMEGVEPLGYDPEMAELFWTLGARVFSLTWNRRNAFADGLGEPPGGGLSRLGEEVVDRLDALGAVIDLAHASERTFVEVLERAQRSRVIVSHAACRSLIETPRNISDDQIQAIADRGGVVCIPAQPLGIDPASPTVERMVDHIDHVVSLVGIDHVGLGADFIQQIVRSGAVLTMPGALLPEGMPIDAAIEGLAGPDEYPNLVAELERRGYEGRRLEAVLAGNLLRVLSEGLPAR